MQDQQLRGKVMAFGKNTKIAIEMIRTWSYKKFEEKFKQGFMNEYGTAPDFDLRVAYNQIQDELRNMGYEVSKEILKKGKKKK